MGTCIPNKHYNEELKTMVKSLAVDGNKINYNINDPIISLGIQYEIFRNENMRLKINNRIYELCF